MYTNTKSRNSSNKQTNTTKLSSSRLKYHILRLRSLTQTFSTEGERFANKSILDIKTHFKPAETFQYTHFSSCHPLGVKKGFIKGEALRLLRTNSSEHEFKTKISHFRANLIERGYSESLITATLSDIKFEMPNLKQILMQKWHLIQQQPLLSELFQDPLVVSYKRGRSLKDILVRAKL